MSAKVLAEADERSGSANDAGVPEFINRLIFETSPYLLQHAHNPVNWYPWGDAAFARAKALHWRQAMLKQQAVSLQKLLP